MQRRWYLAQPVRWQMSPVKGWGVPSAERAVLASPMISLL
ncbi:hypothetical protein PAMC26510_08750 [Caballeronia sordidicola]|uniref:Uncharacterized protein n=1 Tax=Caballeronia sordidicola TaxID=196367 RepID=A0A242N247_CABSO|nr:hypothetical protein PAMC26510_08750 [Caballeronia sordidicola]